MVAKNKRCTTLIANVVALVRVRARVLLKMRDALETFTADFAGEFLFGRMIGNVAIVPCLVLKRPIALFAYEELSFANCKTMKAKVIKGIILQCKPWRTKTWYGNINQSKNSHSYTNKYISASL